MKRAKKDPKAWMHTEQGASRYKAARAEAQKKANELGFDFGLAGNDLFREFMIFMLPAKLNRCGHELRCEVVMCEDMTKCQPGHGPL
jgi:hypothetical protein